MSDRKRKDLSTVSVASLLSIVALCWVSSEMFPSVATVFLIIALVCAIIALLTYLDVHPLDYWKKRKVDEEAYIIFDIAENPTNPKLEKWPRHDEKIKGVKSVPRSIKCDSWTLIYFVVRNMSSISLDNCVVSIRLGRDFEMLEPDMWSKTFQQQENPPLGPLHDTPHVLKDRTAPPVYKNLEQNKSFRRDIYSARFEGPVTFASTPHPEADDCGYFPVWVKTPITKGAYEIGVVVTPGGGGSDILTKKCLTDKLQVTVCD